MNQSEPISCKLVLTLQFNHDVILCRKRVCVNNVVFKCQLLQRLLQLGFKNFPCFFKFDMYASAMKR